MESPLRQPAGPAAQHLTGPPPWKKANQATRDELRRLRERVAQLEEEVQECRRLNRRVAEVTDVVAEVLLPADQRDEERLRRLLSDYRQGPVKRTEASTSSDEHGGRKLTTRTAAYQHYWDSFYSTKASSVPEEPSTFAFWARARMRPGQHLVELGFGTARDSLWFARQGHRVTGFDFAESALRRAHGRSAGVAAETSFSILDLYDAAAVDALGRELAVSVDSPAVYGRFLLHSLEDHGRANLLDFAATVLAEGGGLFLEFRTGQDRETQHVFGDDHFRAYLDPETVIDEIEDRGGRVVESFVGHGVAVYKTEDPHVARIFACWSS